jgi:hypothetical protein
MEKDIFGWPDKETDKHTNRLMDGRSYRQTNRLIQTDADAKVKLRQETGTFGNTQAC